MNGAESLIRTAVAAGVEFCFANPGTTEMPLVAALDDAPGIRAVLGLFEGVCTGAADGYGRMADRPAMTLLHLGPGFANGIANLHNARRAQSPVFNVIGDHASWHLAADAPLTSDISSLASPVSGWLRTSGSANAVAADAAEGIAAAGALPGRVATLIVPHDFQWEEADGPVAAQPPAAPASFNGGAVDQAAAALRGDDTAVLFLGGLGVREHGLRAAGRIAAATGCRLVSETFPARMDRGAGLPQVERFPYFPEQGLDALSGVKTVVLAGAKSPVAFFGYKDMPSAILTDEQDGVVLAAPDADAAAGLEALADALNAPAAGDASRKVQRPERPSGDLRPDTVAAAIAALQPDGAIIMEEGATTGLHYYDTAGGCPPHAYLTLTGGAIGQGPPCATGAALACPDRPVINLQADGSGMYTVQALWTQAREGLNVTTLVCANRSYRILQFELMRAGVGDPGEQARSLMDLANPAIDWVHLAQGFGVPGVCVDMADGLVKELERALVEPGPHLIEMLL